MFNLIKRHLLWASLMGVVAVMVQVFFFQLFNLLQHPVPEAFSYNMLQVISLITVPLCVLAFNLWAGFNNDLETQYQKIFNDKQSALRLTQLNNKKLWPESLRIKRNGLELKCWVNDIGQVFSAKGSWSNEEGVSKEIEFGLLTSLVAVTLVKGNERIVVNKLLSQHDRDRFTVFSLSGRRYIAL